MSDLDNTYAVDSKGSCRVLAWHGNIFTIRTVWLAFGSIPLCMLTIGHSTLPIDIFIQALLENGVALLVDVLTFLVRGIIR